MNQRVRPLWNGLRFIPGSIRIIALRLAVIVLVTIPTLVASCSGIASLAARRPYYTEFDGRLSSAHLTRLVEDLPTALVPTIVVAVVLGLIADQIVLAVALAVFDPEAENRGRIKLLAMLRQHGMTHFWTFLRATFLGLVMVALGIALIRFGFKRLEIVAYRSAWSAETVMLRLPMLTLLAELLWFAFCGAWVLWCRLMMAAGDRRLVRRTGLLVLRVFWRFPIRSMAMFVILTLVSTGVSLAVLIAWRQAEPGSVGGAMMWLVLWLFTLLLQALAWHWLVRSATLLYSSSRLVDIRQAPDSPYGILARVARMWKRGAAASQV